MGTITLNAREDLTYEEIYEGYANGKSRLPKIIKQIEEGALSLAESTGIDIKRRRTEGGNAETPGNVGQTNSTVAAKLISASRWTSLIAGYVGPGSGFVTPPSFNMQTVNVRQVIKEPFDLIDQVAGINFADQIPGAASETRELSGREVKIQEKGTGVRIREIDTRAPAGATADIDVRDFFPNDRIGGGGATGEVHGVDQGIPELIRAESEGRAVGNSAATYDLSGGDDNLFTFDFGETVNVDVVFTKAVLTAQEVANAINDRVDEVKAGLTAAQVEQGEFFGIPVNDQVAIIEADGTLALHTRNRGGLNPEASQPSAIVILTANTVLGFTVGDNTVGATVGSVDGVFEQTVVDLDPDAQQTRTTLRYGTAQFGVLRIVGTTNGLDEATASAFIVHPDFLEDLINFQ
jgi:hypothetical protein